MAQSTLPAPAVAASGEEIARRIGCSACHVDLPRPDDPPGRPFSPGGLPDDSLFESLRHPRGLHDFHLDDAEALALTLFLGRSSETRALRRLRDRHSSVDAETGRRLFTALNCAGCHVTEGIDPVPAAPLLSFEGSRVKAGWLRRFLLDPTAIRPYGPASGAGARMPDLAMNESEADSLTSFLMRGRTDLPPFRPDPLTAFEREKAATLLESRFSCLGCHAWNGRGGRIGPDLAAAAARLDPKWIRAMLDSPGHLVPGTIMPATRAPSEMLDLIAALLAASQEEPARDSIRDGYLSLKDNTPAAVPAPSAARYHTWCAPCHGRSGQGDGYNAPFLRASPADHTDSSAMALRSDDVLYDAIAAGGRVLDRSPEMPAFGTALSPAMIRELVATIREICSCEGPAWSGDGAGR